MNAEEELRAMEAAIEAENKKLGLENAPEPSVEEEPQVTEPVQTEEPKVETPVEPEPEPQPKADIEIPDNLPEEYHDMFKQEAIRRSDAIITRNRQKDKEELEKAKQALRAEDVIGNEAPQVEPVKPKTYDEIMSDIPEESREELKPLLDKVKQITESQVSDLRSLQQQQLAVQRHQIEKDHFNELINKYKGFGFTQEMFDEAKQLQRQYPQYTVAQIVQQRHAGSLGDFVVEKKVQAALEKIRNEPAEHPGGSVSGSSPSRTQTQTNLENMSDEEKVRWYEQNLPKAHGFTETSYFRR